MARREIRRCMRCARRLRKPAGWKVVVVDSPEGLVCPKCAAQMRATVAVSGRAMGQRELARANRIAAARGEIAIPEAVLDARSDDERHLALPARVRDDDRGVLAVVFLATGVDDLTAGPTELDASWLMVEAGEWEAWGRCLVPGGALLAFLALVGTSGAGQGRIDRPVTLRDIDTT